MSDEDIETEDFPEDSPEDELEDEIVDEIIAVEDEVVEEEVVEEPFVEFEGAEAVPDEETAEALDELEAEELELLEDEVSESLLVDEVAELRAIRREELTMNVEAQAVRGDEFVCRSCFLVKRTSQLANKRKMLCRDCAS